VAVFGLFDRLLLRPLPFHEPDRLVQIQLFVNRDPNLPQAFLPVAYADALARRRDIFSGLAYANGATRVATRPISGENPLLLSALAPNALGVLGVQPALGRGFVERDVADPFDQPVMLTYEAWRGRFFASEDVLRLSWTEGRVSYRVVGVLPEGFLLPSSRLLERVDGVLSFRSGRLGRGELITAPFARLQPGVSIAQAQEASRSTLAMMPWEATEAPPPGDPAAGLTVRPLQSGIAVLVAPYLWLLFGAVWLVFAVAAVNLAVLLYTWQRAREGETGLRIALGATPVHLTRSVFLETVAVCGAGALLAWLSYSVTRTELLAIVPPSLRGFAVTAADGRVIATTVAGAMLAALAVSIVPVRAALSVDLLRTFDRRRHHAGRRRVTVPAALLALEAVLAFSVLVAAVTTVPAYLSLLVGSPGFDPEDLHVAYVEHDWSRERTEAPQDQWPRVTAILEAAGTLPGTEGAAAALAFDPLGGEPDEDFSATLSRPDGHLVPVSARFFEVLRMAFVAGRAFTAGEIADRSTVAVLNEEAVDALWPGVQPGDALARRVPMRGGDRTVVGVVRNVNKYPGAPVAPTAFLPFTSAEVTRGGTDVPVLLRMSPDRVPDPRFLQTALNQRFPARRLRIESVSESLRPWLETPRLLAVLLGVAGVTAVVLIATALYAVARFEVTRREVDLRIRTLLGATGWQIRMVVLRQVLVPVAAGVALGGVLAFVVALNWEPFGDSRRPLAYASAGLIVLATSLLATWFPTSRVAASSASNMLRSN
jgi:putative ABC transport system permease protein